MENTWSHMRVRNSKPKNYTQGMYRQYRENSISDFFFWKDPIVRVNKNILTNSIL